MKAIIACLKALSQHSPWETRQNTINFKPG
jgi:hypothetical protein